MVEVKILSVIVAFMVMAKLTVIIVVVNMNYSIGLLLLFIVDS